MTDKTYSQVSLYGAGFRRVFKIALANVDKKGDYGTHQFHFGVAEKDGGYEFFAVGCSTGTIAYARAEVLDYTGETEGNPLAGMTITFDDATEILKKATTNRDITIDIRRDLETGDIEFLMKNIEIPSYVFHSSKNSTEFYPGFSIAFKKVKDPDFELEVSSRQFLRVLAMHKTPGGPFGFGLYIQGDEVRDGVDSITIESRNWEEDDGERIVANLHRSLLPAKLIRVSKENEVIHLFIADLRKLLRVSADIDKGLPEKTKMLYRLAWKFAVPGGSFGTWDTTVLRIDEVGVRHPTTYLVQTNRAH